MMAECWPAPGGFGGWLGIENICFGRDVFRDAASHKYCTVIGSQWVAVWVRNHAADGNLICDYEGTDA